MAEALVGTDSLGGVLEDDFPEEEDDGPIRHRQGAASVLLDEKDREVTTGDEVA